MNTTTPKRKGRLAGRPQRSAPAKVQIAAGEPIPLPAKHKRILTQARRSISDALDCLYEIENNIQRGEIHFYSLNTTGLSRVCCRFKRLCRSVAAVAAHARKEDAQ